MLILGKSIQSFHCKHCNICSLTSLQETTMVQIHRFRLIFIAFIIALITFGFSNRTVIHAASAANSTGHVTVLILDMSGSMNQNDPDGLRCSAANAYIDLSRAGNYIGIIGLANSDGNRGGSHNFTRAGVWATPTEMTTVAARQSLRGTIATKSSNCHPNGNTPTYDALAQAQQMLASATQGGKLTGSVILLTDGQPEPDTDAQLSAIRSDLSPVFKQNGWPIDTIALGQDTGFHSFLSDLSNATSGKFYDDSHGRVSGVSPLNLEPFFIEIFKIRNGRTPGPTINPTPVNGSVQQNFSVGAFVSHLDVIVAKEKSNTQVTLIAPNNEPITSSTANAFISQDPHYFIFSLDEPRFGQWQVNVNGSGQFLMDSLIVSRLKLAITSPGQGKTLPLGQPVTINATLSDQGKQVVGSQAELKATVSFAGNGNETPREVLLKDNNSSGEYKGTFTLPATATRGSYLIEVNAKESSETAAESQVTVQFALFPTAMLISPDTGQPTKDLVKANVVTWDPILRFIYGSAPFFSSSLWGWHPSDLALNGRSAESRALFQGVVRAGDVSYDGAQLTATAKAEGSSQVINLTVISENGGRFRLLFPSGVTGKYNITITTTGQFRDSFGQLSTTTTPVEVTIGTLSWLDELRAWGITLLYLLIMTIVAIFGIYGPINYTLRAKAHGQARLIDMSANRRAQTRAQLDPGLPLRWKGWSLRRYFAPHVLPASEISLPENLSFIFRRGNEVAVRVKPPRKSEEAPQWQIDGRQITHADGTETIFSHMKIGYKEGTASYEWAFEQDSKNTDTISGSRGGMMDRIEDTAGNIGLRDRIRRGRGLRMD
jgi:hypothetical protein